VRLRRGEFAPALADYEAALRLRPQMASARFGRGLTQLRLGRQAEGQADLQAAQAAEPAIAADFAKYGLTP